MLANGLKRIYDTATQFIDYIILQSLEVIRIIEQKPTEWDNESKFLYPLLLSIIAACIFWIIFSGIPYIIKYIKFRPIVELDLRKIYSGTHTIIDYFFIIVPHRPSALQDQVRGGKISKNQIRIVLQNKCLSECYLSDQRVPGELIPIGSDVRNKAIEIEQQIDKVISMNSYTSNYEIVLIERLRQCLKAFQFDERYLNNPFTIIGNRKIGPVVTNVDELTEKVFELYRFYLELQEHLFVKARSLEKIDQFRIDKAICLYFQETYKKSKAYSSRCSNVKDGAAQFFESYSILSDYKLGRKKTAYKRLRQLLENSIKENGKVDLVSYRNFYGAISLNDESARNIISEFASNEEIQKMIKTLGDEKLITKEFIFRNLAIYNYFKLLDKRMPELSLDEFDEFLKEI
jgi:hypothetical protein